MRILVTGANSPLGLAFTKLLRDMDHYVIGTLRSPRQLIKPEFCNEYLELDLFNLEKIKSLPTKLDCIVHIAAANEGDPRNLFLVNGLATHLLAEFACTYKISKFIHISSMSVYGSVNMPEVNVNTPICHPAPYGISKFAGECYLKALAGKVSSVSIRSPAIVGPSAHRHFLAKAVDKMLLNRDCIRIKNPDFYFNNLVHVSTFSKFLLTLLNNEFDGHHAFPIASTDPMRLIDIIDRLKTACRFEGEIVWEEATQSSFSINLQEAKDFGYIPRKVSEELEEWILSIPS